LIGKEVTPDVAYLVEVEHFSARWAAARTIRRSLFV
jgi:hypothetical protein